MDIPLRAHRLIKEDADEWMVAHSQSEKTNEEDEIREVAPEDINNWLTHKVRVISKKMSVEAQLAQRKIWLRDSHSSPFLVESIHKSFQKHKIPLVIVDVEEDSIKKAIEDAKWISELDDDWDDEGSLGYTKELLEKVEMLLTSWKDKSWSDYRRTFPLPDIQPGPDGSIDLHWKKETYELLLSIPNNEQPVHFYGDDYSENVMKGSFSQGAEMPNFLFWLYSVS
jgi:hypothetical protein